MVDESQAEQNRIKSERSISLDTHWIVSRATRFQPSYRRCNAEIQSSLLDGIRVRAGNGLSLDASSSGCPTGMRGVQRLVDFKLTAGLRNVGLLRIFSQIQKIWAVATIALTAVAGCDSIAKKRGSALATELESPWILELTLRTDERERLGALTAEFHSLRIFEAAVRATHVGHA